VPAETHTQRDPVELTAVLDLVSAVVGVDPDAAASTPLAEVELDNDLAVLALWAVVAEEFGERALGELEPLEPRPATLAELVEAFHAALTS